MSIVTKTGDKGWTGLYAGGRISKDDIRMEACGGVDELCSFLGLARSIVSRRNTKLILQDIQQDLFLIGAELGTDPRHLRKLTLRISRSDIAKLDRHIARLEPKARLTRRFVLPGSSLPSAILDVARAVARRVERRVVTLSRRNRLKNPHIMVYLNRLSDLLFILARRP